MRDWIRLGDNFYRKDNISLVTAKTGPEHASGYFGVYAMVGASYIPVPGTYPSLNAAFDAAEEFISNNL